MVMTMTTMMMKTMTMVGCNWPGASVRQLCQVCGSHRLHPPLVWLKIILSSIKFVFRFLFFLPPPTSCLIENNTFPPLFHFLFSSSSTHHPFDRKQYFSSRIFFLFSSSSTFLQDCCKIVLVGHPPNIYKCKSQRWDQIIEETVARDHFALAPPTPVWTFQKIVEAWTLDGVGVVQIRLYSYLPSASISPSINNNAMSVV